MSNENIYSPPQSQAVASHAYEAPLASRGERFKASLIDGVIAVVCTAPILWYFIQKGIKNHEQLALKDMLILNISGFLMMLLINGYYWHRHGQSIGKKIIGIKMVDMTGNKPPLWKIAILRQWLWSVCGFIPVIGNFLIFIDVLFVFTKNRRCIHDYLAGTKVVKMDC